MTTSIAMPHRKAGTARSSARRNVASRRAWVAVLTALAGLLALQLATAVLLTWGLPGVVDPDYRSRLARVEKGRAADPEHTRTVVMLGSSRTYYALHTDALNAPLSRAMQQPVSVVNFGFTGAGPVMELLTWRRLQHDGVRPSLVLIEVHPAFLSTLFPATTRSSEVLLPTPRVRRVDIPTLERYSPGERPTLRQEVALAEFDPLYTRRIGVVHALAPALLPRTGEMKALVERLAPDPFPADFPIKMREGARDYAHREYGPYLQAENFCLGGPCCEALHELVQSCRAAGAPAALVVLPEGQAFRSWYAPETWTRIQSWLDQFSREESVPLIMAREWINEADFVDSHHLLPRGADKFTEQLGQEVILPMLRQHAESRR